MDHFETGQRVRVIDGSYRIGAEGTVVVAAEFVKGFVSVHVKFDSDDAVASLQPRVLEVIDG